MGGNTVTHDLQQSGEDDLKAKGAFNIERTYGLDC